MGPALYMLHSYFCSVYISISHSFVHITQRTSIQVQVYAYKYYHSLHFHSAVNVGKKSHQMRESDDSHKFRMTAYSSNQMMECDDTYVDQLAGADERHAFILSSDQSIVLLFIKQTFKNAKW